MSTIIEKLMPVIQPIVESEGCELVDIEYVKEGANWYLRVFIDKDQGVDINDCAIVSEQLSSALDQLNPDPFPKAYFLEVASPGAERPLKTEADLEKAVGSYVHVDYYVHQNGESFHEGELLELTPESMILSIRVKTRQQKLEIQRKDIAKIRLAVKI